MDGDRPVVDRHNIFESKLQELVWEAFCEGWTFGDEDLPDPECCAYAETTEAHERYNKRIHELLISCLDGQTGDVGPQDEVAERRALGDHVRSEGYLRQLTSREPDEIKISDDGTAIFKIRNVLQNPR